MGKPRGFIEIARVKQAYRLPGERIQDHREIYEETSSESVQQQASRCMDCGVPFCQSSNGCPIDNLIPEWNDLVTEGRWREAFDRLHLTNNFPEFTGRVCPAPCEGACVLGITDPPVAIKTIEAAIADRGYREGWLVAKPPLRRSGQSVAIIGSGPAGLAAAAQLNANGHDVTVYERSDRIGGLLVYGIPNMKLDKELVDRRIRLMEEEGIAFQTNAHVGVNVDVRQLLADHEAILIATGATMARDLEQLPGRQLKGIHFAMDFLKFQTQRQLEGCEASELELCKEFADLRAKGKRVIVIGGGDTGTDCIAQALRDGASKVINLEVMDRPPAERASTNPWPQWPKIFRMDYGHEEAVALQGEDPRLYSVRSLEFLDDGQGYVAGLVIVRGKMTQLDGEWRFEEYPGSRQVLHADLVLLAMGFVSPDPGLLDVLGVTRTQRATIAAKEGCYQTNLPGVFAAGDCRRGQSLVVWAIQEGRRAAESIDEYLRSFANR